MTELHYLSATEAIASFKARKLSPVELLQAVIDQAERIEPYMNAFSHTDYEDALKQAKQAEKRYLKGTERPLEGIPTAIKSSYAIAGKPTSTGSLVEQDYVPDTTSPIVQRLLDAGAIVHARTTTPEFTCVGYTWSNRWGITRNPWNLEMTPGGSSGGSGAALAAGTTLLANGGDIAGSIRIPASLCGLVGFKAPYGRNPDDPPYNLEYFYSPGPMARNVADCILMQNVISGPHPGDIASLKPKLTLPAQYKNIKKWRIAYSIDLGYQPVADEVHQNTIKALDIFRGLGATVEEVEINWSWDVLKAAIYHLGYAASGAPLVQSLAAKNRSALTPYARYHAEQSKQITRSQAYEAEMIAGRMYSKLNAIFENYDVFICPTIANTGVAADFDYRKDNMIINGEAVDASLGWVMTYPFNILSRCPVLAIPSGQASNRVPTGIQIVGPAYEDVNVFQAAAAYETVPWPAIPNFDDLRSISSSNS